MKHQLGCATQRRQTANTSSRQSRCRRACLAIAAQSAPVEQAEAGAGSAGRAADAAEQSASSAHDPNAVTVTEERLPHSHIRLTVTVPPALVRKSYDKGLKQLRAKTTIPGFRAGKKVCACVYSLMLPVLATACASCHAAAAGQELRPVRCMAGCRQVPPQVLLEAVGGAEMANGTCVERMLKDILPVVRMGCMAIAACLGSLAGARTLSTLRRHRKDEHMQMPVVTAAVHARRHCSPTGTPQSRSRSASRRTLIA